MRIISSSRLLTTAANGLAERIHRQLKAALRTRDQPKNWKESLPLVLLDIGCSAAFWNPVFFTGEICVTLNYPLYLVPSCLWVAIVSDALSSSHDGPSDVRKSFDRTFEVMVNDYLDTVSIDRLKPTAIGTTISNLPYIASHFLPLPLAVFEIFPHAVAIYCPTIGQRNPSLLIRTRSPQPPV